MKPPSQLKLRPHTLATTLVAALLLAAPAMLANPATAVAPVDITLAGSDVVDQDTPVTYAGVVTLSGTGVPAQTIDLVADGVVLATATTAMDGSFSADVTFPTRGTYQLTAVLLRDTPAEASSAPIEVQVDHFTSLAVGERHTCGIMLQGGVKCWGSGHGSTPTTVPGLTDVVELALGQTHTCALRSDAKVFCWGQNNAGQLGDGTTTARATPTLIPGFSGAASIGAGDYHTCAVWPLSMSGVVRCTGSNSWGQLGDGTTQYRTSPVQALYVTNAVKVDIAGSTTCVLFSYGYVGCWGANHVGQHGSGSSATYTTHWTNHAQISGVTDLSLGAAYACARTTSGSAYCWGYNGYGQLGDGTTSHHWYPAPVTGLANVADVGVGYDVACAVLTNGDARCWGRNEYGIVGDGTTGGNRVYATPVVNVSGAVSIGAGDIHGCVLLQDGNAKCWGHPAYTGSGTGGPTPQLVL